MRNIDRVKLYTSMRRDAEPESEKYKFALHLNHYVDGVTCTYLVKSESNRLNEAVFFVDLNTNFIKCVDADGHNQKTISDMERVLRDWLNMEIDI